MTNLLEGLLEDLELVSLRGSDEKCEELVGEEAVRYLDNIHKYIEQGIEASFKEIGIIKPRAERMLGLYDPVVLRGYSDEKDKKYEEELAGICIPCFVNLPKGQPVFIKLRWALTRLNQPNSMDFIDIRDEAGELEGEELERFGYLIRRDFVSGMKNVERNYQYHRKNPLGEVPEDKGLDDESSDWWYDLRGEKKQINLSFFGVRVLYQLMVELVKRKS